MSDGKKRKLVICDTLRADGGEISVKTNSDKSKCNLRVAFANKFITGMPPKTTAIEREPFTATVEVKVKKNNYSWKRVYLTSYISCKSCSFIPFRTQRLQLNFMSVERKLQQEVMIE